MHLSHSVGVDMALYYCSGRWNGTMKPAWLEGTNLTRFDVPGLFNQIWADPVGVACEDLDVMAGW
jgi:cellobiose dehydrogenase (acceptor)